MKKSNPVQKEGGDPKMLMKGDGVKLGRHPKKDRGEIILNNGFSRKQWEWYRQEAAKKSMDTMTLVRVAAQWFMDSVESSRAGSIATPEDDQKFEKLIKNSKQSKTRKRKKE